MSNENDLFGDIFQQNNVGENEPWKKEWQNMPEYISENQQAKFSVIVNFESIEDLLAFGKLLEQKITYKTQSIWFPKVDKVTAIDKRWNVTVSE